MSLAHVDGQHQPSPFVTAVEEAKEEIGNSLNLLPSEFKMIGIALNWQDLDINLYGYAETGIPVVDLLGDFRRDHYEGETTAIPFNPRDVLRHIASQKWEPTSAMVMCSTLFAHFEQSEVEAAARHVPAKGWQKFLERS